MAIDVHYPNLYMCPLKENKYGCGNTYIRSVSDTNAPRLSMQDERLLELLVGFRFHPTDTELIAHYLWRRTQGFSEFPICSIQECDIYKYEPWNLPCDSFRFRNEEKEMYFFTPRHPSSGCPQRASRTAGKGYWKGYGKDKLIKIGSEVIGHKTALTFKLLKGKKEIKTDWIMHEYRLQSPSNNRHDKKFDDLVLCRIHEKKSCSEETNGVGIIVEERRGKRRQVEGLEQQCLMDESGGKGSYGINTASSKYESSSSHFMRKKPHVLHSFKTSDFLRAIVRKVARLKRTDASGDIRLPKKRKAVDEGRNNDENSKRSETEMVACHNNNGSSNRGQGRGRPHAGEKEIAHCGRIEDDLGTSTLDSNNDKPYCLKFSDEGLDAREEQETIVSIGSASQGQGRVRPCGGEKGIARCDRLEDDPGTSTPDSNDNKTYDLKVSCEGLDARKEEEMIVSNGNTSQGQERSQPQAGENIGHYGRFEDDQGNSILDSNNNKHYDLKFSDEGLDARAEKEMIIGNISGELAGVVRNIDLNIALDDNGDIQFHIIAASSIFGCKHSSP